MSGMPSSLSPPLEIVLDQSARELRLVYSGGESFTLSCEYLRVFSPSAAVRGHGPGQEVLQVGKRGVNIVSIEPVGHYAVRLVFSDGHDSGLYSWDYLYELGRRKDDNWLDYLARLQAAGASRD
ncbi:MAG: 1-(5-phosphoribosyl)-5-((5-phosphoribosylamino)methylideneamino)imidazole-4-carboxamide isomerase [Proteobacteria bacterium]|nr:1-(5-phosphoribosyl)-5-((5-phosphoribosylamino)methylideneamino)imidazole-4-carboxamide isomerase [Pseudomonadota bacterium]